MKLTKLKLGGIGRFSGDVEVPIEQLNGSRLVAVVGENGAGKTTALECLPGAFYRTTPSRGPIAAMANRKDSFLEVGIEINNKPLLARIMIDGVSRQQKVEAYLLNDDETPITSGKVRDFIAEVERRLPSQDVFLSSAFAAQNGSGSFLDLPPAQRKELFASLLGLGGLQALADKASARAKTCELDLAALRAKEGAQREQADGCADLMARLHDARNTLSDLETELNQREREVEGQRAAVEEWSKLHDDLRDKMYVVATIENNAKLNLSRAEDSVKSHRREAEGRDRRIREAKSEIENRDELRALVSAGELAETRIREVEDAMRRAESVRRERDNLEHKISRIEMDIGTADKQRQTIGVVPCGEAHLDLADRCPLLALAVGADRLHGELSAELSMLKAKLDELPEQASTIEDPRPLRDALIKAAAAKAKLDRIDTIKLELESLAEQLRSEQSAVIVAEQDLVAAKDQYAAAQDKLKKSNIEVLDHAETKPKTIDEYEIRRLRSEESRAKIEVAKLTAMVDGARAAEARLAEISLKIEAGSANLDDWKHLTTALGKSGIQALEIDNASPGVSALTNDLLHACYGPRFSVSLETCRLRALGKGTKEVIDLRVIDTERGTEGSADHLSGGEQVLISEALSLAIAIYNTRQSNIPMADLFRDECAGALSPDNSVRYIEMLRRALDLGGFHRCYFVAHQPQLWDLADSKIIFEGGGCRVEGIV